MPRVNNSDSEIASDSDSDSEKVNGIIGADNFLAYGTNTDNITPSKDKEDALLYWECNIKDKNWGFNSMMTGLIELVFICMTKLKRTHHKMQHQVLGNFKNIYVAPRVVLNHMMMLLHNIPFCLRLDVNQ